MEASLSSASADARPRRIGTRAALRYAATFWFVTAAAGLSAFLYFILAFYAGSIVRGDWAAWNRKDLITGFVAGDFAGNLQFAAHVLVAAVITASGALQLVPGLRVRAPAFHRWNGRIYLAAALFMSLGGLWLVWGRGSYLTVTGAVAISLDAVLILAFGGLALRDAMARRIDRHRRWALRLFVAANGVWFQRIGYMAWILVNQGPVGIGKRLDGPFDLFWGFGCYLVPLGVLELYLLAGRRSNAVAKFAMAVVLGLLTLLMGVGIAGAYLFMWRPVL